MNPRTYLTPWTIGDGVAGLVFSVATIITLIISRHQVGSAIVKISTHLFSQIGFFRLVIVVFLIISVLKSGNG